MGNHSSTNYPNQDKGYNLFELGQIIDEIKNEGAKKQCLGLIPALSTHKILADENGKFSGTRTITTGSDYSQLKLQVVAEYDIAVYFKYLGKSPGVVLYFSPSQELVLQKLRTKL
jgi:hypothetical protein